MVWEVRAMLLSPLSWPVLLSDTKGERRHVLTDLCCLPPTILLVPSLFMRDRGFRKEKRKRWETNENLFTRVPLAQYLNI